MKALQPAKCFLASPARRSTPWKRMAACTISNAASDDSINKATALPHWSKSEELLEDYISEGYCPTTVGDILGSETQYRVLRKLGWGVYSTVWLVENQRYANRHALLHLFYHVFLRDGTRAALKLMTGYCFISLLNHLRSNQLHGRFR